MTRSSTLIRFLSALALLAVGATAEAKLVTKTVRYQHDGANLQGYLVYDDASQARRPGVLVIHEWWGLNDFAREKARQLAEQGYVAFAADMYGDGKSTDQPAQAKEWSQAVGSKPGLLAARAQAALDELRRQPQVDGQRLAAIGFCFGGGAALQLAYSGAPLRGAVSFHGSLPVPSAEQLAQIKSPLLILHGADDPLANAEAVDKLRKALTGSPVDWQLTLYGGAQHAFTNPAADSHKIPGLAYNAKAAQRSWDAMLRLFQEQFGK